jgi:hypothetical protein
MKVLLALLPCLFFTACSKEGRYQIVTTHYYNPSREEVLKIDTKTGESWYLVGGPLSEGATVATPMAWVEVGEWKPGQRPANDPYAGLQEAPPPPH